MQKICDEDVIYEANYTIDDKVIEYLYSQKQRI